jgi:hypothetical protein
MLVPRRGQTITSRLKQCAKFGSHPQFGCKIKTCPLDGRARIHIQCTKKHGATHGHAMETTSSEGTDVSVLDAGSAEINRWANANPGKSLCLREARLEDSDLSGALLKCADLSRAEFNNCKFVDAKFDQAVLVHTRFLNCDLTRASFKATNLSSSEMADCVLDESVFAAAVAFSQVRSLHTCRVVDKKHDVHFDLACCRILDRYLGWGRIRTVGQLRLFLPSYGALIISIISMTVIAFLNVQLNLSQELAASLFEKGLINNALLQKVMQATTPMSPSWRHFAVLLSTSAIATGATLYLLCPSRVREFTLDQWRFVADRPAFEYYTQSWSLPAIRVVCVAAYAVGVALALVLLGDTLARLICLLVNGLSN